MKNKRQRLLIWLCFFFICGGIHAAEFEQPLSLEKCIEIAIAGNADVGVVNSDIEEYRARLAEVQANYYPKLSILSYVAPMFTVNGNAFTPDVERKYDLGSWGPWTHLEALLAMPIYSFGRIEAGEAAAKSRLEVEKARLREAQNLVKVEVTKFYYTYLYAKSLLPHLNNAQEQLTDIREKAQEFYDNATGKVTKVDLMKLQFADTEIKKYLLMANEGVELALAALKHTMGLETDTFISIKEEKMPDVGNQDAPTSETELIAIAETNRPEWVQIRHGLKAVDALRKAESRFNYPIVFVAGSLETNWTPTRDDAKNPYHYDPYNDMFGGVAVGIKWDLDWALAKAKIDSAKAKTMQVNALKQKAITGIPVQIKKARSEVLRYREQVSLSETAHKAGKKWVVFAAAAYASGTGEVKDVLEGLAVMLSTKRDYYENSLKYLIATAELDYAVGR